MMEEELFNGWAGITRSLAITLALGSTLATIVLSKDVALAEGVAALAPLIGLQLAITWLAVRSETISRLVKAEPSMLPYDGRFLRAAMQREHVVEAEVLSAVRQQAFAALANVQAVVLETDGSFTCIGRTERDAASALDGLLAARANRR